MCLCESHNILCMCVSAWVRECVSVCARVRGFENVKMYLPECVSVCVRECVSANEKLGPGFCNKNENVCLQVLMVSPQRISTSDVMLLVKSSCVAEFRVP